MKYSTKLSDAVHVMVLIAINQEKSLSSASIAESVHTNPGFVRQLMLKLKKAELMTSVAGHARPSLSKPADQITLLDIYKAVEGDKPLLHLDTHTNPDCGVGINILFLFIFSSFLLDYRVTLYYILTFVNPIIFK